MVCKNEDNMMQWVEKTPLPLHADDTFQSVFFLRSWSPAIKGITVRSLAISWKYTNQATFLTRNFIRRTYRRFMWSRHKKTCARFNGAKGREPIESNIGRIRLCWTAGHWSMARDVKKGRALFSINRNLCHSVMLSTRQHGAASPATTSLYDKI